MCINPSLIKKCLFFYFFAFYSPSLLFSVTMAGDKAGKDDKAKPGKDGDKAKEAEKKAPAPQLTPRDGV